MRDLLPAGSHFSAFGIGRMQMPMVAQAVLLGGNVRVGLEDNLYLGRGVLASNGELVERACEIVRLLGARVLARRRPRRSLACGGPMRVAIVGTGVIGAGWAARASPAGWT